MNKLSYIISVPVIAITLGFITPEIDLHRNVREAHNTQLIQQKQGTDKKKSDHITNRFKVWSKKRNEDKNKKSDKLESSRTRRGNRNARDFRNQIRERYNEVYGDQRRVAQFYVNSWFVTSFSLDLDDNTILRVKDVYAKAISEVGLATKGNSRRSKEWREKASSLRKIHSTFDRELKQTLDAEQYERLKKMTRINRKEKEVDKGET